MLTLFDPSKYRSDLNEREEDKIKFIISGTDSTKRFKPTKQSFNTIPLLVQLMIIFPWFFAIFLWWNYWLVSKRLVEFSCFVTFIGSVHQIRNSRIFISYVFDWDSSLRCIVTISSGQVHFNNDLVICGYHVKLGIPSAFGFSDGLLSSFFKAPCASGCSLQEVLSKANTSTLIAIIFSCCNALKIRCITPFSHHLLNLWYMLFHLPYFSGSALHLHPFSAIYKIALINV